MNDLYQTKKTSTMITTEHDALVLPIFSDKQSLSEQAKAIDEKLDGQLTELLKEKLINGKGKVISVLYPFGKLAAKRLFIVGVGKKKEFTEEVFRETVATTAKKLAAEKIKNAAFILTPLIEALDESAERAAHVLAETMELALYEFENYKQKSNEVDVKLESLTVYVKDNEAAIQAALDIGEIYGQATNYARTLVNTPGNLLTPTDLAEEAVGLASKHGFEIDVLEQEQLEKLGMGALLAVAQGSDEKPKMIVLKYKGKKDWDDVLAFVGKGLTFDAGGISLKPSAGMHEMKMDMGGAAAVLGAMDIVGQLKPEANILAVIPTTENLVNGSALKPGDVITSFSGKTIEVLNTDAEGRLILADGVAYAKHLGANAIVNVATLTGAVLVALGDCTTGAVTNNEGLMEEVLEAAFDADEWVWRLPNYKPYKEMVKSSDVADLNNAPGRNAGSITAGLFIGEFAGDTPWVHLDIAGTAWSTKQTALCPKGGTGVMVRTLANVADEWGNK